MSMRLIKAHKYLIKIHQTQKLKKAKSLYKVLLKRIQYKDKSRNSQIIKLNRYKNNK